MSFIQDEFTKKTPISRRLYQDAKNHLPGGVGGAGKFIRPYPIYIKNARGGRITDVDGNEYIDVLMGAGPIVLGHNPEPVLEAVRQQMKIACHTFYATELEIELAKTIKKHMPHLEMIRFTNTGSEGTKSAIRAARAFRGRDKIAKFEGNFHGSDDYFLISCAAPQVRGPDSAPQPVFDCPGIPSAVLDTVLILPYNDAEATETLLRKHAHELAAVIMEVVAVTPGGGVCAEKEFLERVRQVTKEEGIILIFDEIVTGFRLGLGGAAGYFGVTPDMAVIGKAIGGGFPIGAFGGRRDIMDQVLTPTATPEDAKRVIFQSGTFTANPISMTAGLVTLAELEKTDPYPYIDKLGEQLRNGLRNVFERSGVPAQVTGVGSIYNFLFSERPIRNRRDVLRSNLGLQAEFCLGLIVKGILQPMRHAGFLCAAHTEEDIGQFLAAAQDVLREMKSQGMIT